MRLLPTPVSIAALTVHARGVLDPVMLRYLSGSELAEVALALQSRRD